MSTAASAFAGLGERVPDPIDMQRAMCPRSIPPVADIISPRGPAASFSPSGSPRSMRYSFLKGQHTHFLSSDTMNDIAASHVRKEGALGGADTEHGDSAEEDEAAMKRRADNRNEFEFSRKYKPAVLDLSPSAVKKSALASRHNDAKVDLQTVFHRIDMKGDGKIDAEEVEALLKGLGYDPEAGEVEDIIWEVDDDCDGVLNWEEFQSLYYRVGKDEHGKEPRRMYTIIEYCLFDIDGRGCVEIKEVMEMFYKRYGRIAELAEKDKTGSITFRQFVKRDTAFYTLSRQIEDSRKIVQANKRREMLDLLNENGMSADEAKQLRPTLPKVSATTPRGGVPAASVKTRTGLRDIKKGTNTGHIRSETGRLPRQEERRRKQAAKAKRTSELRARKQAAAAAKPVRNPSTLEPVLTCAVAELR